MTVNPQANNWDEKLSAIIGLVLGLLFIGGGAWVRQMNRYEQATLTETQGTVVDIVKRRDRDSSSNQDKETYAPVIEFQVNDQPIRFTGRYESYRSSNGHPVVVRYNPDQPALTAREVDPFEGLTAWGMFGMGGLAVVCSLGPLLPLPTWLKGGR